MSDLVVFNPFEAALAASDARSKAALQVANDTKSQLIAYQTVTDGRLDVHDGRLETLEGLVEGLLTGNSKPKGRKDAKPATAAPAPPVDQPGPVADGAAPSRVSGNKTHGSAMALYFKSTSGVLTHIATASKARQMFNNKDGFIVFYNTSGVETAWKK